MKRVWRHFAHARLSQRHVLAGASAMAGRERVAEAFRGGLTSTRRCEGFEEAKRASSSSSAGRRWVSGARRQGRSRADSPRPVRMSGLPPYWSGDSRSPSGAHPVQTTITRPRRLHPRLLGPGLTPAQRSVADLFLRAAFPARLGFGARSLAQGLQGKIWRRTGANGLSPAAITIPNQDGRSGKSQGPPPWRR